MALYRILSRTRLPSPSPPPLCTESMSVCLRRRCSSNAEIIEIDMESASAPAKIEEMFQNMMVKKSTPDWLPFLPGSSFWVPPTGRAARRVVDLFGRLNDRQKVDSDHEDWISVTTERGWPSSSYYLKDNGLMDDAVEDAVVVLTVSTVSDDES